MHPLLESSWLYAMQFWSLKWVQQWLIHLLQTVAQHAFETVQHYSVAPAKQLYHAYLVGWQGCSEP